MVENYTQIPVKKFAEELKTGKYTLIDCRTAEEQKIYGIISEDQMFINVNDATAGEQIDKLDKKNSLPCILLAWK